MTYHTELKRLAEAAPEGPWFGPEYAPGTSYVFDVDLGTLLEYQSIDSEKDACLRYVAAANPAAVLALIAENERLAANVKLNLCDYPAIHRGDVELLVSFVTGASQIELAKVHHCTPPNISRKIRRVKDRLGWREGMPVSEIRDRAEQLRALASRGAVVTADLMVERDQVRAEVAGLKTGYQAYEQVNAELKAEVERLRKSKSEPCDGCFMEEAEAEALRKDADRYRWLQQWYIEGRKRSEIHPDGHICFTTPAIMDTAIDAAMGKGEQS